MLTLAERIEGGVLGLLIGDALGVPYEFHPPTALPAEVDMVPPAGFRRSHPTVPPGTWSDDGAQALCLLESLLQRGRLDVDDFAQRLVAWYLDGHLAVDSRVFDVGNQTAAALSAIRRGAAVLEAAPTGEHSNGNGSLMRALPLALWHRGTDEALVIDAHLQSRVTHPHPRSEACCALYCLWARRELAGAQRAFEEAAAALREIYSSTAYAAHAAELEEHIRPDDPTPGRGTGYVVDCLRSARSVLATHSSVEAVLRAAVALGHDTDTTACVAGGIAGVRHGARALPDRWLTQLRGMELVRPLLGALVRRS